MKRSRNSKEETLGLQKHAPNSGTVAPTKTRDQLVNELKTIVRKATGTQDYRVAERIIGQVVNTQVFPTPRDADHVTKALAAISEMAPQNVTEAMLAVQMISTHDAALLFPRRATTEGHSLAGAEASVLSATRLLRLRLNQIEAMQKLKGKTGQQKVTVEHVHVYRGGQAIVGAVGPAKSEPRDEDQS